MCFLIQYSNPKGYHTLDKRYGLPLSKISVYYTTEKLLSQPFCYVSQHSFCIGALFTNKRSRFCDSFFPLIYLLKKLLYCGKTTEHAPKALPCRRRVRPLWLYPFQDFTKNSLKPSGGQFAGRWAERPFPPIPHRYERRRRCKHPRKRREPPRTWGYCSP